MAGLFESFPYLESNKIIIRRMTADDVEALCEITENDNIYRYIPPFLYRKSRGNLLAAIKNVGGRDFDKKKMIIAGIYPAEMPSKLIGLAEVFDYRKRYGEITIGCKLNETFWNKGIATETIRLMKEYLCGCDEIKTIKAFVMPENIYSAKALLNNGFYMENERTVGNNWGGQDTVKLDVFTYINKPLSDAARTGDEL